MGNSEKKLHHIVQKARQVVLAPKEKDEIKSQILHFMKNNPAASNIDHSSIGSITKNKYWLQEYFGSVSRFVNMRPVMRYASVIVVCVLLGSAGVSFAAQNALPGDILYPIKTGIAEKMVGLVLISDEAKAEYNINLTQIRLEETEAVIAKNKLSAKATETVRGLLDDHIADVQIKINRIKNKEDDQLAIELNSQLESLLKAHAQVIAALEQSDKGNNSAGAHAILSDLENTTNEIMSARKAVELNLSLQPTSIAKINAEKKLGEIQSKIKKTKGFISNNIVNISGNDRVSSKQNIETAQGNIAVADGIVAQGESELKAGDYNKAYLLFQKASRAVDETEIGVSASINLKKDLLLPKIQIDDDKNKSEDGNNSEKSGANAVIKGILGK
jgi:hypothetical protein